MKAHRRESRSRAEEGHPFLPAGWPPCRHSLPSIGAPPRSLLPTRWKGHHHDFPAEREGGGEGEKSLRQRMGEGREGAGECGDEGEAPWHLEA